MFLLSSAPYCCLLVIVLCLAAVVPGSTIDCSLYTSDNHILTTLGFHVRTSRTNDHLATDTNAEVNANGQVIALNIHNERFIPPTIFCLNHLSWLYVDNSSFYQVKLDDESLYTIPSEIGRLAPTLRSLRFVNMPISRLPDEVFLLTRLLSFNILGSGLQILPAKIGMLTSLQSLRLRGNKLYSLPTTIRQLPALTSISIDRNPIASLAPIDGMTSLEHVSANDCSIKQLPRDLPMLYWLSMYGNQLESLDGIATLGSSSTKDKYFWLYKNQIKAIPSEISQVKNLIILSLNSNQLQDLPDEIYSVKELRELHLDHNRFTDAQKEAIKSRFKRDNPILQLEI